MLNQHNLVYNVEETAEFLRISKEMVYILANSGELRGSRIGRRWVFLHDELIGYLGKTRDAFQEKINNPHMIEVKKCHLSGAAKVRSTRMNLVSQVTDIEAVLGRPLSRLRNNLKLS